ncbi:MAG: hypothetical protein J4F37_07375 [Acidobacteria bacterium]|nr:hypothetical protein [Acidobacteriota bacterium]
MSTRSRVGLPRLPGGLPGRLRLSGLLIVSGLGVELATFFWNHPVSFFLFAVPGAALMGAGMLLYLWSVVTGVE